MTSRAISDASKVKAGRRLSIYKEKFARNTFTAKEQETIRTSVFTMIGLGGTGGFMLENLLRMGAERFEIFEDDRIELSNFNRQMLSNDDNLDQLKSAAAKAHARSINDGAILRFCGRYDGRTNLHRSDIVLDGSDDIATKALAASASYTAKIPYVFCSASGERGIVSVFSGYGFRKAFQLPDKRKGSAALDPYKRCSSIICPAAAIAGSLAASQAVNALISKPISLAPDAIFFDLSKKDPFWRARLG